MNQAILTQGIKQSLAQLQAQDSISPHSPSAYNSQPKSPSTKDGLACCGKKYSRIDTLRNHYLKAHDIKSPQSANPSANLPPPSNPPVNHRRLPFKNMYSARLRSTAASALLVPIDRSKQRDSEVDDEEELDVDTNEYDEESSDEIKEEPKKKEVEIQKTIVVDGRSTMRKTAHDYIPKHIMRTISDSQELLVPINIELEVNGSVLHDTFTWNFNEKSLTPERYAQLLCQDLEISPTLYVPQIAASFRSQMAEYSQYFIYNDLPAFPDSRITIKLDLALGHVKLSDRFEWDLSSYDLTPETFARQMVADLNLGGEYAPIIAHAITEQIIKAKMEDEVEVQAAIECGFRDNEKVPDFCPFIQPIRETDYERAKIDTERRARRMRRESKGVPRSKRYTERRVKDEKSMEEGWKCVHCRSANGEEVGREGEYGGKLCRPCGAWYLFTGELPVHRKELFKYA